MKNKIFSLILAFTLFFLLAGCKNEPSQLPETDEPKETEYYLSDGKENACDDAEACETCIQTAESSIIAYFENEKEEGKVKFFELEDLDIDEEETVRNISRYAGSELARTKKWSTPYLEENFLVVRAEYSAEYDGTKSPDNSGDILHYMIMTYNLENSSWEWVDSYMR